MSIKKKISELSACCKKEPLYLMDGSSFVYRAFYANPNMKRSDSFPTGVLFTVSKLLLKLLKEEEPQYFVFVLDGKGKNFRHKLYPTYKAQRSPTPEDLIRQIEPCLEIIRSLGIRTIVSSDCEADDCIASLAHKFKAERPVIILGSDKDLKQCLTENVFLCDPTGKSEKIIGLADFEAETGLKPEIWPDFQAVTGDSSDNIPGILGIGPKTAMKIFEQFTNLEEIRDNIDELGHKLGDKLKQKILPDLNQIFLYRQLTRLSLDCCSEEKLTDLSLHLPDWEKAQSLFRSFALNSLLHNFKENLGGYIQKINRVNDKSAESQQLLYDNESGFKTDFGPARGVEPGSGVASGVGSAVSFISSSLSVLPLFSSAASTFSAVQGLSEQGLQLFRQELDLKDLPDFSLQDVVLLEKNAVYFVYTELLQEKKAYLYTIKLQSRAELEFFIQVLSQSRSIILPDLKALLTKSRLWSVVSLSKYFDLGLAAYLLNPEERDYSLLHILKCYAPELGVAEDIVADIFTETEYTDLLFSCALKLAEQFRLRLQQDNLVELMFGLELPLVPVLAAMERSGISLDLSAFTAFLNQVQLELDKLSLEIYASAGEQFNIRSSQQLAEILFVKLKLPKSGKTKKGALTTSQEALERLSGKHELIDLLVEYRKLEKLRSTYLEPFPKLVDKKGRIHTSFNQLATATGRLSSSRPNLQNIPVRGKLGRQMRSCFKASTDNLLISADYSQIELRVLAHLSQDPALVKAFRQGEDIHTSTAGLLFDKDSSQISTEERRSAKTINFGIIYGMGAQKLAGELKISSAQAKSFIERYFEKLATLKSFFEEVVKKTKEQGFIITMAGRRRFIPDINSRNPNMESQAKRHAINTLIQGSAADIIKMAMFETYNCKELKELKAKLILQVHDELILEAPESLAKQAGQHLASIMTGIKPGGVDLRVPLVVDWGVGKDWGGAH